MSVVARHYNINANLIFTWPRSPLQADGGWRGHTVLPAGGGGAGCAVVRARRISDARFEIALSNGQPVDAGGPGGRVHCSVASASGSDREPCAVRGAPAW